MAAEQSSSVPVPLLLAELPRVPPITITKNESQEYVISRGNNRVTITPRLESTVSSGPSSSYVVDCNSYVSQPCNYETLVNGSFVRPTTTTDSYSNINQLTHVDSRNQSTTVLQEPTLFQNAPSHVTVHSGSTMPNASCHNDDYSSPYASTNSSNDTYSSSNSDGYRTSYNGNVLNMSNYRSTISSSSTSTISVANSTPFSSSVSVDSPSFSLNPASTSWGSLSSPAKSVNVHRTHSTFPSSAQSSNSHVSKGAVAGGKSIQFVDLTFSSDSGNCRNPTSRPTSSIKDGNSRNPVTSLLASSVNVVDSSQESSRTKRINSSYTDSQLKIKNVLSEITYLMKNVRTCMNAYAKRLNETPQKLEKTDSTDYMAELQRFNAHSNMNTPPNQLLPKGKRLFTACREQCQKYFLMMIQKENLTAEDEMMIYTMKLFLINLRKLFTLQGENTLYESATSSTPTASRCQSTDVEVTLDSWNSRTSLAPIAKDDPIEKYEQLLKYKDFKINYFKTLLDEKKDVEKKLEEAKQRCTELEEKLKQKEAVGCWREENMSEWCCEVMSELKTNMLKLLENEFKCCICDELLIEPVITNCQHVFCTFCLDTWREKKKECPVCRAFVTNVYKVNAIDDYITAATGSLSDKAYAERLQVIEDRKNTNPPPPKKPSWSGLQNASPVHVLTPAPTIPQPRPSVSHFPPPYSFAERNASWHAPVDRFIFTTTGHHSFPSSTDIPTSGPWSQQNIPNIPLNTGAGRHPRSSTAVFFSSVVAAEPSEGRTLDRFP